MPYSLHPSAQPHPRGARYGAIYNNFIPELPDVVIHMEALRERIVGPTLKRITLRGLAPRTPDALDALVPARRI